MQILLVLFGLLTLGLAFRLWDRDAAPTPLPVAPTGHPASRDPRAAPPEPPPAPGCPQA